MKNLINFFRSYEEVKLGDNTFYIEHSSLENMFGCAIGGVGLIVTSPLLIATLLGYGLYAAGEYEYNKIKRKRTKNEEVRKFGKH